VGAALSEFNYRVALAPSRRAAGFILLAGAATAVLIVALPLDPLVQLAAIAWIGAGTFEAYRAIALRKGPRGIAGFALCGDSIEVSSENEARTGHLAHESFVSPWLTVIRWRPTGARLDRTVLILPDMLPHEDFRQLRVLLKTGDRSLVPRTGTLGTDHSQ
jgi:hypothetical protein